MFTASKRREFWPEGFKNPRCRAHGVDAFVARSVRTQASRRLQISCGLVSRTTREPNPGEYNRSRHHHTRVRVPSIDNSQRFIGRPRGPRSLLHIPVRTPLSGDSKAAAMMSMAQPFPAQSVGMPHAGVSHGHPMAMGHPPNPGAPGGGQPPGAAMGQQMHPGVSGAGGPQVSQAGSMMANIPLGAGGPGPGGPGAGGPSAHALSHLNPGQAQQMYAQQQQQMAQARKFNFPISLDVLNPAHLSCGCGLLP